MLVIGEGLTMLNRRALLGGLVAGFVGCMAETDDEPSTDTVLPATDAVCDADGCPAFVETMAAAVEAALSDDELAALSAMPFTSLSLDDMRVRKALVAAIDAWFVTELATTGPVAQARQALDAEEQSWADIWEQAKTYVSDTKALCLSFAPCALGYKIVFGVREMVIRAVEAVAAKAEATVNAVRDTASKLKDNLSNWGGCVFKSSSTKCWGGGGSGGTGGSGGSGGTGGGSIGGGSIGGGAPAPKQKNPIDSARPGR